MILSIINVFIALITLGLGYYNLKFVKGEYREKRKFKIYLPTSNTTVPKNANDKKIIISFENVGESELIATDIQTTYNYIPDQTFHIGTLKPNEKQSFIYRLDEVIEKHKKSKNVKTEVEIPIVIGYFNKYFNTHIIVNKSICLVVQNHHVVDDLLIAKTKHLYVESKKLNEYKS